VNQNSAQALSFKNLRSTTRFEDASFIVGNSNYRITIPIVTDTLAIVNSAQTLTNKTLMSSIIQESTIQAPVFEKITANTFDYINTTWLNPTYTKCTHYSMGSLRVYFLNGTFAQTASTDGRLVNLFDIKAYDLLANIALFYGRGFITAWSSYSTTVIHVFLDENNHGFVLRDFPFIMNHQIYVYCMYFV